MDPLSLCGEPRLLLAASGPLPPADLLPPAAAAVARVAEAVPRAVMHHGPGRNVRGVWHAGDGTGGQRQDRSLVGGIWAQRSGRSGR